MIAPIAANKAAFSTEVRLLLEIEGGSQSISAVGPDRFVLAEPRQLAECYAVLVISVNGEPRRTPIRVAASDAPAREFAYTVR